MIRVALLLLSLLLPVLGVEEKVPYASENDCDRYSLDAVYHEKIRPQTETVFTDCQEFVSQICEKMYESLNNIMGEIPERDFSDRDEMRIYKQFKDVKDGFVSRVKKLQRNITTTWDSLLADHSDLMLDNGKITLAHYLGRVQKMSGAYEEGRRNLDSYLESFIRYMREMVRTGMRGITAAAAMAVRKEEAKKNETATEDVEEIKVEEDSEEEKLKEKETKIQDEKVEEKTEEEKRKEEEEKIESKMLEVAEMIVQGFVGKLSLEVIRNKIDLYKKIDILPEDRETPLDDLLFDIIMAKNRMHAVIHVDLPRDKGGVDLARRSVYQYWSAVAEQMYRHRIQSKGEEKSRKLATEDEDDLAEVLLEMFDVYP